MDRVGSKVSDSAAREKMRSDISASGQFLKSKVDRITGAVAYGIGEDKISQKKRQEASSSERSAILHLVKGAAASAVGAAAGTVAAVGKGIAKTGGNIGAVKESIDTIPGVSMVGSRKLMSAFDMKATAENDIANRSAFAKMAAAVGLGDGADKRLGDSKRAISQAAAIEGLVNRGKGADLGSRVRGLNQPETAMQKGKKALSITGDKVVSGLAAAAKTIGNTTSSAADRVRKAAGSAMNKPMTLKENAVGGSDAVPPSGRARGFQNPKNQAAAQRAKGNQYDGPTQ
jgi:hypothetical protein